MFDVLNQAMLYLLDLLKHLMGGYGLAIIAITVLIRVVLWPMNTAQTKSMRQMQELQPKLKALQERHKDNPQKLQQEMMAFYAENKFNPFAGCLPMLVQLPIFIALYGALNSPEFALQAGNEGFLFVQRLNHTLQSHAGEMMDARFNVQPGDQFQTSKTVVLKLKSGKTIDQHVDNPAALLKVKPQPLIPGEAAKMYFKLSDLHLSSDYKDRIESVSVPIVNTQSRELEKFDFKPSETKNDQWLVKMVPTQAAENTVSFDVLVLIVIYGVLTFAYQKLMEQTQAKSADPQMEAQQKMMKLLPLVFVGVLFFIPIPAGVLLYLVVTMVMMVIQSLYVAWQESQEKNPMPPAKEVLDVTPEASA